jgi:hypothetical protein
LLLFNHFQKGEVMLVTFSCDAHENITMFGNVAQRLLRMMGHSGTIPSALMADDVPDALSRLKAAVGREKAKPVGNLDPDSEEDDGPEVSLAHRAIPLIDLLENAAKENCNVMWR